MLIRTGGSDRTVPPYYLRRIYRLLKEIGAMVNYTELEGKDHWWWDTQYVTLILCQNAPSPKFQHLAERFST